MNKLIFFLVAITVARMSFAQGLIFSERRLSDGYYQVARVNQYNQIEAVSVYYSDSNFKRRLDLRSLSPEASNRILQALYKNPNKTVQMQGDLMNKTRIMERKTRFGTVSFAPKQIEAVGRVIGNEFSYKYFMRDSYGKVLEVSKRVPLSSVKVAYQANSREENVTLDAYFDHDLRVYIPVSAYKKIAQRAVDKKSNIVVVNTDPQAEKEEKQPTKNNKTVKKEKRKLEAIPFDGRFLNDYQRRQQTRRAGSR